MLAVIKGAGDLATGIAHRLVMSNIDVIMTETRMPTAIRRTVAFSEAVFKGEAKVEGIKAKLVLDSAQALKAANMGIVAVIVSPKGEIIEKVSPDVVVDAIIAKKNLGTKINDAPVVVGVGPGFNPGIDCHCAIETKRGHNLGRSLYNSAPAKDTGVPGNIGGYTNERILRSPCDGTFKAVKRIGDLIEKGETVAHVDNQPVTANISGVIRGLLPNDIKVCKGMKSGDIDPRGIIEYCYSISDKSRAIAGGVLEAVLHLSKALTKKEEL